MPPTSAIFRELNQFSESIPLDRLQAWHARTDVKFDELREFLRFHPRHYVRNLVHAGAAYHALLLCWRSGQRSPIHDHVGSCCAVKVLRGIAVETIFQRAPNGMIYPDRSLHLDVGSVTVSQDEDIHQMSNLSPHGTDLVTLHIYSPPLLHMNVYSLTDASVARYHDPINDEFVHGAGI